ncbi:fatty acid desaturase [Thalassolituus oleivorans R6-15]|jgi:fatty acid desaturase|nr:fatty acid desaturase [Thalassolituus oleivorans R6-15]
MATALPSIDIGISGQMIGSMGKAAPDSARYIVIVINRSIPMSSTTGLNSADSLKAAKQKDRQIQSELMAVSDRVRNNHPSLVKHQNAVGMGIFLTSILGMVLNGWLYFEGIMPVWMVIVLSAFWTSLLHELEHDLIHYMYFRKTPFWHHVMMAGVYLARPLTQNPWVRRHTHLHHHKVSGTETDLEERGITNGESWGIRRLLMVGDNMLAFYLRIPKYFIEPRRLLKEGKVNHKDLKNLRLIAAASFTPLGTTLYLIWHLFVLFHLANGIAWTLDAQIAWPQWLLAQQDWVTGLVVVLIAPNVLRTFCLHFISSNMHYYGDNRSGIIHEQCQVMNPWYLLPLQAFCFNFGSTHAIHHFVVRDPFYIRHLATKESHEVLRKHGIRFNDMGTFSRANRMHTKEHYAGINEAANA